MTTEDDFQAALDANPHDWQTRLVFADWLDDRDDARAEGYRALGVLRKRPLYDEREEYREYCWCRESNDAPVNQVAGAAEKGCYRVGVVHGLPESWLTGLQAFTWLSYPSRREAEEAAALAFALLPAARRAELLNPEPEGA